MRAAAHISRTLLVKKLQEKFLGGGGFFQEAPNVSPHLRREPLRKISRNLLLFPTEMGIIEGKCNPARLMPPERKELFRMKQLKHLTDFEGVRGPVLTLVMDGVGLAPSTPGNADAQRTRPRWTV